MGSRRPWAGRLPEGVTVLATKILDISAASERTGLSRRTIYLEIADGRFPRPVQLTARRVGWVESEIEDWIAVRIAARDEVTA